MFTVLHPVFYANLDIITGKIAQKYQGRDIDAMKAVANAHKNRSLSEFQKSLEDFKQGIPLHLYLLMALELMSDPIIRTHFTSLYDNLLEQNLLRIVEPFSRVEVAHVAALVGLPVVEIEFKYILNSRRVNGQVESDDSG
jgi:26S proteasome regulatory subunit N6